MTTTEWLRSKIGPAPHPAPPERVSRAENHSADFFIRHLRPEMRVLHAYCGDGKATFNLATYVPMGEVTGIDPETANLRRARSLSYVPEGGDVSFERCSLDDLPLGPEDFDAVFIDGAFSVERSPERAIEEVKRVLAPGGLLGVRHTVALTRVMSGEAPEIESALQQRDSMLVDQGGDPDAGLKQVSLLRETGFVNLRVTSSTEQKSDDELLIGLAAAGLMPLDRGVEEELDMDEGPPVHCFVTAIETVGWKPFQ